HAQVAQPAHAGLRADGGHAHLDPRVAQRALLGLAGLVVEVDLLVRAAGDAHPPAPAAVLVDQDDAVLGALVHRAGGAGGNAGRVEAVLADPRQVEHEGLLELQADLVAEALHHRVLGGQFGAAGQVVVPVGAPPHLHRLAGQQRPGPGHRRVVAQRRADQVVVVVGPGLVVVLDGRHQRVGEDGRQLLDPPAGPRFEPAGAGARPAALPPVLVLVSARVPLPGAGLHVVEPDVLHAAAVGPGLLAGDRAGVAPDALVQVHHHGDLRHDAADRPLAGRARHQYLTSLVRLRTTVVSSRWLPVGPM